jgi:hypothetical protein
MLLRLATGIAWLTSCLAVWDSFADGVRAMIWVPLIWIISIPCAWLVMGALYARKFGTRR